MSDVTDRLADSSYKRYLGYLVSTPTDLNLALDIIDRLYWTQCPKPKVYQIVFVFFLRTERDEYRFANCRI